MLAPLDVEVGQKALTLLPVSASDLRVLAEGMSGSAGPLRIEQHRTRGVPIFRRFLETRGFNEGSLYDEFLRDRSMGSGYDVLQFRVEDGQFRGSCVSPRGVQGRGSGVRRCRVGGRR